MNVEKFLQVSTLEPIPRAEEELARMRPFVESRIEQAYQNLKDAVAAIQQATPETEPIVKKLRPVLWEAVALSDVVYRRVVAILNLARNSKIDLTFELAAEQILSQTPARDVPEQASFLSFIDRLYTLWRALKDAGYYKKDNDDRFAVDALLPLRPLHCGTNAMNANFVPGKRHYIDAQETRRVRMWGDGRASKSDVVIRPSGDQATEVTFEEQTRLLTRAEPTMVLGRPLKLEELFTLRVVDPQGKNAELEFPVDAVITKDCMFSRGAIRITRCLTDEDEPRIVVTENGAYFDVDLGDRRYVASPDPRSGLHGMTHFFDLRTSPSEGSDLRT